eukprot:4280935-Prorocentrum_lima.AAC.1
MVILHRLIGQNSMPPLTGFSINGETKALLSSLAIGMHGFNAAGRKNRPIWGLGSSALRGLPSAHKMTSR